MGKMNERDESITKNDIMIGDIVVKKWEGKERKNKTTKK